MSVGVGVEKQVSPEQKQKLPEESRHFNTEDIVACQIL